MKFRSLFMLAASLAVLAGVAVADTPRARFSNALSYVGPARFALTLSVIEAGGGPKAWSTTTFMTALAGDKASAEVDKLGKQFGADTIKQFVQIFDFAMSDGIRLVGERKMAMPKAPDP